jgi:PRC-barrel domain
MNLTRLAFTQHPRPHQRELRQRSVFDSGDRRIGHVVNIYVDNDENFRFVEVAVGGLMGFGKKHHLVPVEAIAEEEPGSITLTVDQQTVQSAPALDDPHAAPEEGLQRAAREHCGLSAVPPEP